MNLTITYNDTKIPVRVLSVTGQKPCTTNAHQCESDWDYTGWVDIEWEFLNTEDLDFYSQEEIDSMETEVLRLYQEQVEDLV